MHIERHSPTRAWFIVAAALVAALLGLLVLIGWVADLPFVENLGPVRATMRTNAALAVILAGFSLGALAGVARLRPPQRSFGAGCAIGTLGIAALTLMQHTLAVDLGVDQLVFSDSAPGRMSKPAATGFLLLGVSLLLLHIGRWLRVAQALSLLALLLSGFFCLGYLYRGPEFVSFGPFGPIAVPTALALLVLSLGVLAASPNTGLVGLLAGGGGSGRTARLLIPAAILVPVVASYARLAWQRAGWYDTDVGLALFTLLTIVALVALVWWADSRIQRSERLRRQADESLRESEQRFRRLLEGVPHLVWTCRPDGPCDYLSRQWVEYTGRSEADHLGSGWQEAIHPDDRSQLVVDWQRAVAKRAPFDSECRIRSVTDEYRWFRVQAVWVAEGDGGRWFGTCSDLHDKKRAEERVRELNATLERRVAERTAAFRESEERYRVFVDNATDAFFIHDSTGKILDANERACESLGYTRDELVGMTPLDFDPDATHEQLEEITRAMGSGARPSFETWHRRKDGTVFPVEVRIRPFTVRGEQCSISIARDLTERKVMEAEQRLSDFAISRVSVASYLIAPDARILRVNQANCEMLGYAEGELTRMTVHDINPEFPPEVWPRHWAELRDKQYMRFESRLRHRDGRTIPVEIEINYLQFEGREYNFAFARDITERKRAEADLLESEERYRLAIRATNDAVWDIDVTSGTVHWSEKYTSAFGRPPETADSWQWWIDRIHPDDRDRTAGSLRAAVDGTVQTWSSDYRFQLPNGEWADIRDRAYIARDPAGKAVRVVGAMQDVTAFRQASNERDRIWNFSLDPMCVAGFDGYFKQVNPAWERTLGWTAEELTSRPWLDFVHSDDRQATEDVAGELLGGQLLYYFENRYRHKNGSYRWLSWRVSPLAEAERIFGIARDVTEQKRAEAALRESEERFRAMADAAPVLIWLADTTRQCVWFNRQWLEFVGRAMAQETGDGWVENVHPDDTARCFATYAEAFAARRPFTMEYRLRRHDGVYRWLLDTGVPRFDTGGEFVGFIGSCVDITERVLAAAALRESEERLRLALTAGRMGIFDWDLATNAVVWSDTHYELFGYPSGDRFPIEYRHFIDRIHPDDRSAVERALRDAMETGAPYQNESRVLLPDGAIRWVMGAGEFQYDPAGRPVRMLGTASDITDRKLTEAELVMRDRAIRAVNQGIVITDPNLPDNPTVYVSPGFEKMSGYSPAEFVGRNCRFLQGPDTDKAEVARIAAAVQDGVPYSGVLLNYRKDGTTFWNELRITPVRDSNGHLVNFVGIQTDVTARRSLEDQLRQAQKMEAVGQLAGGVAHDFNNLLTVINGYCELLLLGMSPDHPMREPMTGVRDAGERAANLTQQLLAFSRRTIVAPRVLDVNDLVGSGSRMLRRLIGEDVSLVTVLSPSPCLVRIDPGQLEQAIMNLVVNARDAMPTGGRLTIETNREEVLGATPDCPPGCYVRLTVTDTGTGMTDEVKARIFEPFFTTKGVGQGTGLGLAMVYGFTHQAGGTVRVESAVGRGTTFTLLMPEVQAATDDHQPADGAALVAPGGSETILLVEDEDAVRMISRLALEMQGYTVIETASGAEAIAIATTSAGPLHLLVTDVVMPDQGGRELADEIRRHRPAVRVLYVSGYTSDTVVRHGIEDEVDAFLQKPFTPLTLARKVREVLDAPRPE